MSYQGLKLSITRITELAATEQRHLPYAHRILLGPDSFGPDRAVKLDVTLAAREAPRAVVVADDGMTPRRSRTPRYSEPVTRTRRNSTRRCLRRLFASPPTHSLPVSQLRAVHRPRQER